MKFKSIKRAIKRGHIKLVPLRNMKMGENINDVPTDMYRVSNRGNLIRIS